MDIRADAAILRAKFPVSAGSSGKVADHFTRKAFSLNTADRALLEARLSVDYVIAERLSNSKHLFVALDGSGSKKERG